MKSPANGARFGGAAKVRAARLNFAGEGILSVSLVALLFFGVLLSSGCVGLTSSSKPSSGQKTAPAAAISVAPSSVSFGSVAVGSTSSQSVVISNRGASDVRITQATTTAVGVTIAGISLPLVVRAGKEAALDIVFSPKAPGALSGTVSVLTDASSSASVVSLSGAGMAATPFLTTSTSQLMFGSVAIGKTGALSVTLTNSGNYNVAVSNVSVSGASYSTSGVSAGLVLTPGQSATLDAKFSPQAAGAWSGSVSVVSTAANSPSIISLSGDGSQMGSHSVTLTWTPSTSLVAGYNVYRSEAPGGPYSKLGTASVAANEYVDADVEAGLTYYYVTTAVTFAGLESSDSTQASATIPTP
jgi:hypothetical protein